MVTPAVKALRSRYRHQLLRVVRKRWFEPHILFIYVLKVATHYHYAAITRALAQEGSDVFPSLSALQPTSIIIQKSSGSAPRGTSIFEACQVSGGPVTSSAGHE
jgi:hypothetical protein